MAHLGNQAVWTREVHKMQASPGIVLTKHLVAWGAWTCEGHKTHSPSGSAPLQSTWEPEQHRPGKCMKFRVHMILCTFRAPWSLRSVDLGSTCHLGMWQTQCGPCMVSIPHTCQWYLFVVSLPHSTTERVILNKWPHLPHCVRVEIRHWRDLKTEEAKINKDGRTALEVTGTRD